MSITVLLGLQWGDEGKGRITDALASNANIVARFNGGDNAGHSITIGNQVVKLHLVPSGIFREGVLNVVGNGVVFNPKNLLKEIADIRAAGFPVSPKNLAISEAAHMITPGHVALDEAREATGKAQGSTKRGIAFCYMDKARREGIRAGEMHDAPRFLERVRRHVQEVNQLLQEMQQPLLDIEQIAQDYAEAAKEIVPYLQNTFVTMRHALHNGQDILAEGAQAVLLDIDHGTYPYVSSSSASVGGVMTGLAVPPQTIGRVVGVAKAFCTRVGMGTFVTEIHEEQAALRLRGTGSNPWDEYGSTTGRARRVGWLDAVALRYAVQINGVQELAVTKMDILSGLAALPIAVGYRVRGTDTVLNEFPQQNTLLEQCEPVYETLPGWAEDVSSVRTYQDLPTEAKAYLARIEVLSGAKVTLVSVGPEREQLIHCV